MVHDAILELAHVGLLQLGIELWLAEQHDLYQLLVTYLQVVEQTQFLQCLQRHGMRLIHQHHHALALSGLLREQVL